MTEDTFSLQKLKKRSSQMWSLAIAIVVFTISSFYFINGFCRINFVLFPQMAVYVLLGFFHAYNVWSLENSMYKEGQGMFMLFCYFLVYTAWYNIVLLPESGLGYFEWMVVFIALTSNAITEISTQKIKNQFMGQRPLMLIFLGVILFICKMVVFFLFEDSIYDSLILSNSVARFFIVFFAVIGIIFLLQQIFKHITNRDVPKSNTSLHTKKASLISTAVKNVMSFLASLFSFPMLIIILAIICLGGLGITFGFAKSAYNALLDFMEPLLERMMTSGENKIHPSVLYYALQIVSLVIVLFYTVKIEENMKINMKDAKEGERPKALNSNAANDEKPCLENTVEGRLAVFENGTITSQRQNLF